MKMTGLLYKKKVEKEMLDKNKFSESNYIYSDLPQPDCIKINGD